MIRIAPDIFIRRNNDCAICGQAACREFNPNLARLVARNNCYEFNALASRHDGSRSNATLTHLGVHLGVSFVHSDELSKDVLLHEDGNHSGTTVTMLIKMNSERTLNSVFNEFSAGEEEDFSFNKTIVPVRLALYEGEQLVSRSQAKRILNRVEKFKIVLLDFKGVDTIGQAFADEVFRVFARKNPQIELTPIDMNEDVRRMIVAAKKNSD